MFSILFISLSGFLATFSSDPITGAWKKDAGLYLFQNGYFSYTVYTPEAFGYTCGGSYTLEGLDLKLNYEFHTSEPDKVGTSEVMEAAMDQAVLFLNQDSFNRMDMGNESQIAGTWLMINRKRDGVLGAPRDLTAPRKTMKILTGTRFQWIAYNSETKQFSGTGGGHYSAVDGKYTENIEFFSRNQDRVGASLEFEFKVEDGQWHHIGFSSAGEAMYEIWTKRK